MFKKKRRTTESRNVRTPIHEKTQDKEEENIVKKTIRKNQNASNSLFTTSTKIKSSSFTSSGNRIISSTGQKYDTQSLLALVQEQEDLSRLDPSSRPAQDDEMKKPIVDSKQEEYVEEEEEFISLNTNVKKSKKRVRFTNHEDPTESFGSMKNDNDNDMPMESLDMEQDAFEFEQLKRAGMKMESKASFISSSSSQHNNGDSSFLKKDDNDIPSLKVLIMRIETYRISCTTTYNTLTRSLERLSSEKKIVHEEMNLLEKQKVDRTKNVTFFHTIRDWIQDVSFCMRVKIPLMNEWEKAWHTIVAQSHVRATGTVRRYMATQVRRCSIASLMGQNDNVSLDDHQEEKNDMSDQECLHYSNALDELLTTLRHGTIVTTTTSMDYFTDDTLQRAKNQLIAARELIMQDVDLEVADLAYSITKLKTWKTMHGQLYADTYTAHGLRTWLAPFIQYKVLCWDLYAEDKSTLFFDLFPWISILMELNENENEEDDDVLVPHLMSDVVLPHITSSLQSLNTMSFTACSILSSLIDQMILDFEINVENIVALQTILIHGFTTTLTDLCVPIVPNDVRVRNVQVHSFLTQAAWTVLFVLHNLHCFYRLPSFQEAVNHLLITTITTSMGAFLQSEMQSSGEEWIMMVKHLCKTFTVQMVHIVSQNTSTGGQRWRQLVQECSKVTMCNHVQSVRSAIV